MLGCHVYTRSQGTLKKTQQQQQQKEKRQLLIILTLQIVYKEFLETKLYLPYISGYLAFREVEPLMKLIDDLKQEHPKFYPQMILVDGK